MERQQLRKFNDSEKRAHHNALERNRRDKMKESFSHLKEAISTPQGQKISREQILLQAAKFIQKTVTKQQQTAREINELSEKIKKVKREIQELEGNVLGVEKSPPNEDVYDSNMCSGNISMEYQSESEFDNYTSSEDPEWNIHYEI